MIDPAIRKSRITALREVKDFSEIHFQNREKHVGMKIGKLPALLLAMLCNTGCISPVALSTVETTGSNTPFVLNHIGKGQGEGFASLHLTMSPQLPCRPRVCCPL